MVSERPLFKSCKVWRDKLSYQKVSKLSMGSVPLDLNNEWMNDTPFLSREITYYRNLLWWGPESERSIWNMICWTNPMRSILKGRFVRWIHWPTKLTSESVTEWLTFLPTREGARDAYASKKPKVFCNLKGFCAAGLQRPVTVGFQHFLKSKTVACQVLNKQKSSKSLEND